MPIPPIIVDVSDESSLISSIEYYEDSQEIDIIFKKYYVDKLTYFGMIPEFFYSFVESTSKGKFYLKNIKPFFLIKKTNTMAKRVVKCKIDVTKINKGFLYTGEKGTYLNFTVLLNDEEDQYKNNGMIIQDVPSEIYKKEKAANTPKDKMTKGEILGNVKIFGVEGTVAESSPGVESGTLGKFSDDDLPF